MQSLTRSWELVVVALLGISFVALIPWLESRAAFPAEPFDVSVIYRSPAGDIEYFPLIAQLSRGEITDGTIRESEGSRLRSFPHATLLPHAMCFAAFGAYGFVAADMILSAGYFLVLLLFFRTLGTTAASSLVAALVLALPIPTTLSVHFELGSMNTLVPLITDVWGGRIPRPFVSEIYLLLAFVASMRLLSSPAQTSRWIACAVALGLLLQGDFHSMIVFALAGPVLVYLIVRHQGWSRTIRQGGFASLTFTCVVALFVAQRLLEHPDIPARFGVFELDRLAGLARMTWQQSLSPLLITACVLVTAWRIRQTRLKDGIRQSEAPIERLSIYISAVLMASLCGKALSILILGKTVQPYHFGNRLSILCTYSLIGVAVLWVDHVVRNIEIDTPTLRKAASIARPALWIVVLTMLSGVSFYKLHLRRQPSVFTSHLRPINHGYAVRQSPSYRESFSELASFLKTTIRSDSVVASFDHQVFAWWLTFSDGYSFLAEPFVSATPDNELETRLALLCKLLGMSSADYSEFIQLPATQWFWMGAAKYQASSWYTYSSLSDYTRQQREFILQSDYSWQTFVPQREVQRLRGQFEKLSLSELGSRSLDVIVLTNKDREAGLMPPLKGWQQIF